MHPTPPCLRIPGVLTRTDPAGAPVPLLVSSPHSGTFYPPEFSFAAPLDVVRGNEDAFVHELAGEAPRLGATLLACEFARMWIDPNRGLEDVDESILDAPWPGEVAPSYRGASYGVGLIWRYADTGIDMYDRKLSVAEVRRRIIGYYEPYHRALRDGLERLRERFGVVYAIDMHSTRGFDRWRPEARDAPAFDFVVSNGDGRTCEQGFFDEVTCLLRASGRICAENNPFKGGFITRSYGDPAAGVHVLQVEVNRNLYMDMASRQKTDGFDRLREQLTRMLAGASRYAASRAAAQR